MSGPKVVKIKTKQEVRMECQGHIEMLRHTFNEWRKCAVKHDALTIQDEKNFEIKFQEIMNLFERENFAEAQKKSISNIAILADDMQTIEKNATIKAREERSMRRRLLNSAKNLVNRFETTGQVVPKELKNIITLVLTAENDIISSFESALSKFEYEFISSYESVMTQHHVDLATELSEGMNKQTLSDWKLEQKHVSQLELVDSRVDELLSRVLTLESYDIAQPFLDRVALIENESSPNQRALLTDSLIIDLISHINARNEQEKILSSMREICVQLHRYNSNEANTILEIITKAIENKDISNSDVLHERAMTLINNENRTLIGTSRRSAILNGLSELGYDVHENLITAWAENGRIVVKKPDDKMYAVELAGSSDAELVQVQLVTTEQSQSNSKAERDRDMETIWCSEFSKLKSMLNMSGNSMHIENAMPVGFKQLKIVDQKYINQPTVAKSNLTHRKSKMREKTSEN